MNTMIKQGNSSENSYLVFYGHSKYRVPVLIFVQLKFLEC